MQTGVRSRHERLRPRVSAITVKDMFAKATREVLRKAWEARQVLHRLGTKVSVHGSGNQLDIGRARLRRVEISIEGNNNVIRIHPSCNLTHTSFRLVGEGVRVTLGENVKISQSADFRLTGDGASVELARDCTVESARFIARGATEIRVGPDSMLAYDIEIRTTDSHSIIDDATGQRINDDQSVQIGRHVWLGARTTVLKGVTIGDDSVIATGSIVSRNIDAGVVAGGVPARALRNGVHWDRHRI